MKIVEGLKRTLKKKTRLFVILGLVSTALGAADTEIEIRENPKAIGKKTSVAAEINLYGFSASAPDLESRVAGTLIDVKLKRTFTPWLESRLRAGLQLESGTSRSLYNSEFEPRQTLVLNEANLLLAPFSSLTLRAGALNQDEWHSPLLLSNQTFPALIEEFSVSFEKLKVSLTFQQAYAADTQNLQSKTRWFQDSALFFMERLSVNYRESDAFETKLFVSHFLFKDLSAQAAYQSRFLGNSVEGYGNAASRFLFKYQGYEAGAEAFLRLNHWMKPRAQLSFVRNDRASVDSRDGFRAFLSIDFSPTQDFIFSPSAALFRLESDATPALFNDRAFGHTNSQGFSFGLDLGFPSSAMEISLRYFDAKVLTKSPYESNLRWGQLTFSYQYEIL